MTSRSPDQFINSTHPPQLPSIWRNDTGDSSSVHGNRTWKKNQNLNFQKLLVTSLKSAMSRKCIVSKVRLLKMNLSVTSSKRHFEKCRESCCVNFIVKRNQMQCKLWDNSVNRLQKSYKSVTYINKSVKEIERSAKRVQVLLYKKVKWFWQN